MNPTAPTTLTQRLKLASCGSDVSFSDASDTAWDFASASNEERPPLSAHLPDPTNSRCEEGGDGGGGRTESHPEKCRFDVLFGMLTIATMIGDGEAAAVRAVDGLKTEGVGAVKEDVEAAHDDAASVTDRHKSAGGQGVIAVLDNSHEMDRCSCDLVKVQTYKFAGFCNVQCRTHGSFAATHGLSVQHE